MTDAATLIERLAGEGLIGLRAAAQLYGKSRQDRPTHCTTPARHALKGIRKRDGTIVKLEAVWIGRRLMTSKAAVMRFFTAQNQLADAPPPAGLPPSPRARSRAAATASKNLDEILGT